VAHARLVGRAVVFAAALVLGSGGGTAAGAQSGRVTDIADGDTIEVEVGNA